MNVRAWLLVGVCACSDAAEPVGHLLVEYQPRDRAEVRDGDWSAGSAIVVADAPTFPQPVSVRVRVVDETGMDYGVGQVSLNMYGSSNLQPGETTSGCYYRLPDVAATYCTYDFDVVGPGSSMMIVTANAPYEGAAHRDCVYYAVVDATSDVDGLRASLEAQAAKCRAR